VVEELSGQRWVFPSVEPALRLIEEFAIGLTGAADHSGIRAALAAEIPHGDDLDSPWSTYAQDALICVDAGLAAASISDHPMPIWIQYGLEPLSTSLQLRDEDLVRSRGEEYWRREVVSDPDMAKAIAFLRRVTGELSERADVSLSEYHRIATEASVLRPIS
jgi:hypothetical protein